MITVDFDIRPLMAKMKNLSALTMRDMKGLIREQGGVFLGGSKTGMTGISPPMNEGQRGTAAKKAGESSVARDVAMVYGSPAKLYDLIKNRAGARAAQGFWTLVKRKQWSEANDIAERTTGHRLTNFDDGAAHAARRHRRTGRVTKGDPSVYVHEAKHIKSYIKTKQRNVGLLASGWLVAGQRARLNLRAVPAWVRRHTRGQGIGYDREARDSYTLTLGNVSSFAPPGELRRRARYALTYRLSAIRRRLPYIARHAAQKAKLNA